MSLRTSDGLSFYDDNLRFHRIPLALVLMVEHLHRDHGKSVRQINLALGLTDVEVRAVLDSSRP